MRTIVTLAVVLAALASAGAAPAATTTTTYKGKTSSGHTVSARIDGRGIIRRFVAGIRMACVPIQGGGRPLGGSEVFGFTSTIMRAKPHNRFTLNAKPAFHYNEVEMNHDLWLKRRGARISGRVRLQYQFLIPKYPIGTFAIYSCLGGARFRATAGR